MHCRQQQLWLQWLPAAKHSQYLQTQQTDQHRCLNLMQWACCKSELAYGSASFANWGKREESSPLYRSRIMLLPCIKGYWHCKTVFSNKDWGRIWRWSTLKPTSNSASSNKQIKLSTLNHVTVNVPPFVHALMLFKVSMPDKSTKLLCIHSRVWGVWA